MVRFSNDLSYEIIGVFDEKLSGKVGQECFGYKVKSFDDIDWEDDFDTIILSCSDQLTSMSGKNYKKEILSKAKKYNKYIYILLRKLPKIIKICFILRFQVKMCRIIIVQNYIKQLFLS